MYRKPEAEGPHIRSKYWVRPEAATWSYIHAAGLKAGYRHVEVDPKRAHVRHYMLKRKELVGVRNCTHAALKEAGLQPEYGFALTQQERLWAEVEAARRYIDFHTNNSGLVARKAGLPGVRALEVEGSVEVQEL